MGARGGVDPFGPGISDRRQSGRAGPAFRPDHLATGQWRGIVSFRVRAARNEDFQAIYEMAKLTGGGFTNLPADKGTLVAKLARSEDAFSRDAGCAGGRSLRLRPRKCRDGPDPRHLPGVQQGRDQGALLLLPGQHDDPDLARAGPDLPRRDAHALHRFRGQLRGRRPLPPPGRARRRPRRPARAQPLPLHQAPPPALRRRGAGRIARRARPGRRLAFLGCDRGPFLRHDLPGGGLHSTARMARASSPI